MEGIRLTARGCRLVIYPTDAFIAWPHFHRVKRGPFYVCVWWLRFYVAFMRLTAAVLLCVLLAAPARADKKPWYRNPEWWARKTVMAAALTADGFTSCRGFARGGVELGLVGRGGSSCRGVSLKLAGAFAFYNGMDYLSEWYMRPDPSPRWRFASRWSIPLVVAAVHGSAAAQNAME